MLIRRIARPLLSAVFIAEGVEALRTPHSRAVEAAPLIRKGEESLSPDVAAKVPTDPETVVRLTGAVQVGGGALLALGKAPRLASLALAATVVPTAVATNDFWAEDDPDRKAAKRSDFVKNVSLLGGLMIAAVDTEGKPSLGWRGRRAAQRATTAVAAALPIGAASTNGAAAEHVGHGLHVAAERGRDFASVAAARGADLADIARERGPQLAEAARERSAELAEIAKERGPQLAESARVRVNALRST